MKNIIQDLKDAIDYTTGGGGGGGAGAYVYTGNYVDLDP